MTKIEVEKNVTYTREKATLLATGQYFIKFYCLSATFFGKDSLDPIRETCLIKNGHFYASIINGQRYMSFFSNTLTKGFDLAYI